MEEIDIRPGYVYEHHSGSHYIVISVSKSTINSEFSIVLYMDTHGLFWSRPAKEFKMRLISTISHEQLELWDIIKSFALPSVSLPTTTPNSISCNTHATRDDFKRRTWIYDEKIGVYDIDIKT